MIEIKRKNYEVDELIRLVDGENNTLYEFNMQITASEMLEIKKILFEDAENLKKRYIKALPTEKEEIEKETEKKIKAKSNRFEDICFKEHKIKFKELAGDYKYEETVEEIMGFFINFFMEKQMKPLNTSLMNLKKFMNK